jgi:uncharacterized membrane protein
LKQKRSNDQTSDARQRTTRRVSTPLPRGDVPADRGIRDIARLERVAFESRSRVDHVASLITRKAGSASVIVFHTIWFLIWVVLNVRLLNLEPFDPYPFSLLTTIVSLESIFLTLFVLVSQNRMSQEADRRAELDLQVNLLAEKESTMVLRILRDISTHLGLEGKASAELRELLKETHIDELADKLDKALPSEGKK